TGQNMIMGTPIYMSPEQCRGGKNSTDRSDVYSLGTILFELVAGRPPFVADEPGEYIGMHLYKAPPPLASFVPNVSSSLASLVDSMLRKTPENRPAMVVVERALRDLCEALGDVSISSADLALKAPSARSSARSPAPFSSANPLAATDPAVHPIHYA